MIETTCIIPAFNEEGRVANVARAALSAASTDMVIVIDDGSTDATARAIHEVLGRNEHDTPLYLIENDANLGKTESMQRGVKLAKEVGGQSLRTLVFLDADSLPIWSRDQKGNMKLWQLAIHSRSGHLEEPITPKVYEGREDIFVSLLARYIDEIIEPVANGEEVMRTGMYSRNFLTDTLLTTLKHGGRAGNRALPVWLWDSMATALTARHQSIRDWEIEESLNAFVKSLQQEDPELKSGTFMMHGVVNVGSRVKTGSFWKGVARMAHINARAVRGMFKFS